MSVIAGWRGMLGRAEGSNDADHVVDLGLQVGSIDWQASREAIDVTQIGDTTRRMEAGLRADSLTVGGMWAQRVDDVLWERLGKEVALIIAPDDSWGQGDSTMTYLSVGTLDAISPLIGGEVGARRDWSMTLAGPRTIVADDAKIIRGSVGSSAVIQSVDYRVVAAAEDLTVWAWWERISGTTQPRFDLELKRHTTGQTFGSAAAVTVAEHDNWEPEEGALTRLLSSPSGSGATQTRYSVQIIPRTTSNSARVYVLIAALPGGDN